MMALRLNCYLVTVQILNKKKEKNKKSPPPQKNKQT